MNDLEPDTVKAPRMDVAIVVDDVFENAAAMDEYPTEVVEAAERLRTLLEDTA